MTTHSLLVIDEIHSGDLSRSCPMQVKLKQEHKWKNEMPTAMFRGSFAGKALELLHFRHKPEEWNISDNVHGCLIDAAISVNSECERDGRMLTDAVIKNMDVITKEVTTAVQAYINRFASKFAKCELVGVEIPMRMSLKHGDGTFKFASHYDLVFIDPDNVWGQGAGRWHLWDWKWLDKMPVYEYLIRAKQPQLYQLCLYLGWSLLPNKFTGDKGTEGTWIQAKKWVSTALIYIPSLKPYARKTTDLNPSTGVLTEFKKGDERPMSRIVRRCTMRKDRIKDIAHSLLELPRMMRDGHFPAIPDKLGCRLCESSDWCPRFDMPADSLVLDIEEKMAVDSIG